MTQRFTYTQLLIAGTTFAGGIVLGLLFAPRQKNREPIADHATEIANWIDTSGRKTFGKNIHQVQQFRENYRQGIRRHVPDLYEATEHIGLSMSDVPHV